jgi:hypothetical protein
MRLGRPTQHASRPPGRRPAPAGTASKPSAAPRLQFEAFKASERRSVRAWKHLNPSRPTAPKLQGWPVDRPPCSRRAPGYAGHGLLPTGSERESFSPPGAVNRHQTDAAGVTGLIGSQRRSRLVPSDLSNAVTLPAGAARPCRAWERESVQKPARATVSGCRHHRPV